MPAASPVKHDYTVQDKHDAHRIESSNDDLASALMAS